MFYLPMITTSLHQQVYKLYNGGYSVEVTLHSIQQQYTSSFCANMPITTANLYLGVLVPADQEILFRDHWS